MTENSKLSPSRRKHSNRGPKKRYPFMADMDNYLWLCEQARIHRTSIAKILNVILRGKPVPNEFFIR